MKILDYFTYFNFESCLEILCDVILEVTGRIVALK